MKREIIIVAAVALMLGACGKTDNVQIAETEDIVTEQPQGTEIPLITFEAEKGEYYLFDDNPEHLTPDYLADGEIPSSISHFGSLEPGVYTVFSYHHRGDSDDYQADLYYDTVFSSENGGSFEILQIGLDKNWDWNQAWADYTNTPVQMPLYYRIFDCTCGAGTSHRSVENNDCPAVIQNQRRDPKTSLFKSINVVNSLGSGESVFLSDIESRIEAEDINHFRYGGYNEPMWLMMKFRVVSGTVDFDTVAYRNKDVAKANLSVMADGAFRNEPQYKGMAESAPVTTAKFGVTLSENDTLGAIPVMVKNMRVPEGYVIENGTFGVYVNTWREEEPIAAESDLLPLKYRDDTKLSLYGSSVKDTDNIWIFDPYHTKIYSDTYTGADRDLISSYGVPLGNNFEPNIETAVLEYPTGDELCSDDFYRLTACNLGNFGVTTRYEIELSNEDEKTRQFCFDMSSISGQVYRYSCTDESGNVRYSDGGSYIMKKYDDNPPEDPLSQADPKERIEPERYSDTLVFDIGAGEKFDIEIEVTTLTGCKSPMYITMSTY